MSGRNPPRKIVAFDWDAHVLRLVHAHVTKRGVKIDRLLAVPHPADLEHTQSEAMGRHLRRVLDQEGISTRHAIVDIPRDQAILKTMPLPRAKPEELAGIVAIQIAKELPFPASEAVIDFTLGETSEDGGTIDVLVAAARREVREQYEAVFAAAGLRLDRIGLRPYANKVALCRLLQFSMPERAVFIDLRPTLTEIDVLRRGVLVFSRAASVQIPRELPSAPRLSLAMDDDVDRTGIAALDLADSESAAPLVEAPRRGVGPTVESVVNALILELTRSIEAYRANDPGATIDHVVIGGDQGIEEALSEAIQKRLKVSTELYNPASTFGWSPDEGVGAAAFASTLGLVLGHAEADELHFDFLHPKRPGGAARERLRRAPVIGAIAALFIIAIGAFLFQYRRADRIELRTLDDQIAELEKEKSDWGKFLQFTTQLETFDAKQSVWVDVMYELFSQLPSNEVMVVNHLELTQEQTRVVLKTKTKSRDTATDVIGKLEAFRREGKAQPRFKVTMGPQVEKKGEEYPFIQDLRVSILTDDAPTKPGGKGKSSTG